jgi:hypothetical protein
MKNKYKRIGSTAVNLSKMLEEIEAESGNSDSDLRFFLETSGAKVTDPLNFTSESLVLVEKLYREVQSKLPPDERNLLERLLALYLGGTLIRNQKGSWCIYQGKYYTLSPIVIKLSKSGYLDVFLICKDMASKKNLVGARKGESLLNFYENTVNLAVDL